MSEDASTAAKIELLLLPAGVRELDRSEVERSQRRRLQLALAMLAQERGYELASIDEIAERARLSKSTMYELFGGREELLQSAVDDFRALMREGADRALSAASGSLTLTWPEAVRASVSGLCDAADAEPELARLTFVEGPAVLVETGSPDPSESMLREVLRAAAAVAKAPAELQGVQWRALNGAFRSALQDCFRRGHEHGKKSAMAQSLAHLVVVAHLGEGDTEGVPA